MLDSISIIAVLIAFFKMMFLFVSVSILISSYSVQGCKQIELSGTTFYSNFHGMYNVISDTTCNNRPVYESTSGRIYLFYRPLAGWVFRKSSNANAACESKGDTVLGPDNTEYPHLVTSLWREIWYSWSEKLEITVQCNDKQSLVMCAQKPFPEVPMCPAGMVVDVRAIEYVVFGESACLGGSTRKHDSCLISASPNDTTLQLAQHYCDGYRSCHPFPVNQNIYTINCLKVDEFSCADDIQMADFIIDYKCVRDYIGCQNISVEINKLFSNDSTDGNGIYRISNISCGHRNVYHYDNTDYYLYYYMSGWRVFKMANFSCEGEGHMIASSMSGAMFPENVLEPWNIYQNTSWISQNVKSFITCSDDIPVVLHLPPTVMNCTHNAPTFSPRLLSTTRTPSSERSTAGQKQSNNEQANVNGTNSKIPSQDKVGEEKNATQLSSTSRDNIAVPIAVPLAVFLTLGGIVVVTACCYKRYGRCLLCPGPRIVKEDPDGVSYPEFVFDKDDKFDRVEACPMTTDELTSVATPRKTAAKSHFFRGRLAANIMIVQENELGFGYLPDGLDYMNGHKWCNVSRYYNKNIQRD